MVIDATAGFASPISPLGMDGRPVIANIGRLVDAFHERRLPVVFTVHAYLRDDEAPIFRRKVPILNELKVGTPWVEIDSSLTIEPGDLVIRKTVPSAFFDSGLRSKLEALRVDATVICGFSTSGCVRASAMDALQSGFMVTVVEDACGDRDPEAHRYNLRDLRLKTGDVVSTRQVVDTLSTPDRWPDLT
jgi:maleamate amidohydrolase